MQLSEYLTKTETSLSDFAGRSGLSIATVSRLARGLNRPDWKTMLAIHGATDGAVTPNDFSAPVSSPPADETPDAGRAA